MCLVVECNKYNSNVSHKMRLFFCLLKRKVGLSENALNDMFCWKSTGNKKNAWSQCIPLNRVTSILITCSCIFCADNLFSIKFYYWNIFDIFILYRHLAFDCETHIQILTPNGPGIWPNCYFYSIYLGAMKNIDKH